MKQWNVRIKGVAFLIAVAVACGPSPEELKKQEQARQDSLRKVQEQARLTQEAEEAAKTPSENKEEAPAPSPSVEETKAAPVEVIKYDANGTLTLQIEAWRTQRAAEKAVDRWKRKGLENAYVVVKENSETGEVWYRVRIGKFRSAKWAKKQAEQLKAQFEVESWLDNAADEVRVY